MSPRKDVSMTPEEIDFFLAISRAGVLTTLEADGWPHSTAMWFAPEEEALLMWTYGRSQKTLNMERDPRAALLVEAGEQYGELQGVTVRGNVEIVRDTREIALIGRKLYERYTMPTTGVPYDDGPNIEIERQSLKRVGLRLPFERVLSWDFHKL